LNPNLGVHELYVVLRTMPFNHYFGYGLITTWSARSVLHTTQWNYSLAMQTAVLARQFPSVCPSVCPSRSGIVSRWMKIRSCGFQRLVGQSL